MIVDAQAAPAVGGELSAPWYRLVTVRSADDAVPQAIICEDLLAMVVADDLPGVPFAEMARRLHGVLPGLPLIALTRDPAVATVVDLMRSGASDVLMRPLLEVTLVTAVSRLFMGRFPVPAQELASRERQVFALLGEGCSTSDIAGRLRLSIKTVDGTLIRLRSKMGCPEVSSLRRLAVSRSRQTAVQEAVTTAIPVMGLPIVDTGHSAMLTQLCRLEQALESSAVETVTLVQAAEALLAAAHGHNDVEVGLMRDSCFPGLADHQAEHCILLDEIQTIRTRVVEGRAVGGAAFRSFILHWLGQHVQRFDRLMVAHLREHAPASGRGAVRRRNAS